MGSVLTIDRGPKIIDDCSYVLISGQCPLRREYRELYERIFVYWRKFWTETFRSLGESGEVNADDFLRQDFIGAILYKDEIAGLLLHTAFDLELSVTPDSGYFRRSYDERFLKELAARGSRSALSMEYLTIDPDFRRRRGSFGVSCAELLVGLSLHVRRSLDIDVSIGIGRNDVKVTERLLNFNCDILRKDVIFHNVPCDMLAIFEGRETEHRDPGARNAIQSLWDRRHDWTGRTLDSTTPVKKAA